MSHGRFTMPTEENFFEESKKLAELWGADAVRNSDGTQLDHDVLDLGKRVYSAYFPTRGHNEFMVGKMRYVPQVYLLSERTLAEGESVTIPLLSLIHI